MIHYETDPLGRIVKKLSPAADEANSDAVQTESFEYDANGNLVACENAAIRIERCFDDEGHLLEEKQGKACRITNVYDLNGNRLARGIEVNISERRYVNTVHYRFDALDQAIRVEMEGQDPLKLARNALGQVTEETLSKSLRRDFAYSSDGYLTAQKVFAGEGPLFEQNYHYDRAGNLLEKRDSVMGIDQYTYDPLGRLVSHLNPEGRLTKYFNDPAGDRLRTYITGRVSDENSLDGWGREGEYEGIYYRFDRAGNLIERSDLNDESRFSWDANQRLIQSSTNDKITTYQYDPLGRRVRKETDDIITGFFWDGDALLGDMLVEEGKTGALATARLREWVYYPETFEPLIMAQNYGESASELYLYHNDPNGCPTRLLDVAGDVVWAAQYSAWGGVEKLLVDRVDNPIRLQGQYIDSETDLYFNRHRYFDYYTGLFVSQDPLRLLAGDYLYGAGPNNISWIDPLGLSCGRQGERIARNYLESQGFHIIGSLQNRSGHGIDLIARDANGLLHFFEVKTTRGLRAPSLSAAQRQGATSFVASRLQRAALGQGAWGAVHDPHTAARAQSLLSEIGSGGGTVAGEVLEVTLGDGNITRRAW